MIKLSGVSSFQWKTTEQEYPFEKDVDGNTLYAKCFILLNFSAASGSVNVPHGLSSENKIYSLTATHVNNSSIYFHNAAHNVSNVNFAVNVDSYSGNIRAEFPSKVGQGAGTLTIYLIYRK